MQFKKIEVGNASLSSVGEYNLVYVDKTRYIEILENIGTTAPVFLRPRRFGKTLFADTLFCYYDKANAQNFDENFRGTWIHSHPTQFAGAYYCLRFDFSGVETEKTRLTQSFTEVIMSGLKDFSKRYPDKGLPQERRKANLYDTPTQLIRDFIDAFNEHADKGDLLFVIIDEYDHFANDVLTTDKESFKDLTSTAEGHEGLIKKFYITLKSFYGNGDGKPIRRFFITGVSALSLDSLTSGFNIAKNVSRRPELNSMLGFTKDELSKVVDATVDFSKLPSLSKAEIMDVMEKNYDGYVFSEGTDEHLFCPNMCLNFLDNLISAGKLPDDPTDGAMSDDAGKLRGMLALADQSARDALESQIFRKENIFSPAPQLLNLNNDDLFNEDQIVSMLIYLGYLTLDAEAVKSSGKLQYRCPNDVYYQAFLAYESQRLGLKRHQGIDLTAMSGKGDISPLIAEVSKRIAAFPSAGFAGFNERSLQLCFYFTAMDGTDSALTPEIECDSGDHGRADLLIRNSVAGGRQFLFELKYLPKHDDAPQKVTAQLSAAKAQLERYRSAPNFRKLKNLDCWAVVFVNSEPRAVEKLAVQS
ncbi:MAG: AAA family ATPase [Succinivibrio sp.]|jgi:hypothetical protein|nr:AAA family ATPase [Succinivibrio sp.]